jgi:putative heme transporter
MKQKNWFAGAGLLALVLLIVFNFGHLHQFVEIIGKARWYVLLFILATQAFSYYCKAKYYQSFFKIFGYRISTRILYESALAINFVNQAFPSGGISGTSYLSRSLQSEVPAGKTTLAQLGSYVFTFLSFVGVLTVGFVLLFLGDNLSKVTVRIVVLFILLIIVASLLLLTVVNDRKRIERLAERGVGFLNRIKQRFFRRSGVLVRHEHLRRFFDEFYEGYHFLLLEKGHWRKLLGYSLGVNIAEVATIYVVFAAFGVWVNPGVVIVGYTIANMFSVISIVSSGAGLYEASMVGSLTALGVPFALALSVVLVYRVLNFVVFLPAGYLIYRKNV